MKDEGAPEGTIPEVDEVAPPLREFYFYGSPFVSFNSSAAADVTVEMIEFTPVFTAVFIVVFTRVFTFEFKVYVAVFI